LAIIQAYQRSILFPYTTLFRSVALITQTLRYAFVNGRAFFGVPIRAFGLNDDQGNAIHKANNVRAAIFHTAGAGHSEFFGKHKRSEEHTSELQSRENLVCRLLL